MKSQNNRLEKMLVKKFCTFSIIIVVLFALINLMIRIYNDRIIINSLEERYVVNLEGKTDYNDIDLEELEDVGGWLQILDTNYQVIYPETVNKKYSSNEIIDITNGKYQLQDKFYQGMFRNFSDSEGNKRIQVSFFPHDVLDITSTINIPVKINAINFVGVYILGFLILGVGYLTTVFVVSKKIKRNISKPINELRSAMRELGNGMHGKRLMLDENAEYEFVEMGKAFNSMAETMQNAVEKRNEEECLRRQMISDISHDIRTPLTVVQGYLTTIVHGEGVTEEAEQRYLEQCYKSCLEMDRLLEQLSLYNRMLRVDYHIELKRTDLTEFIKEILADQYYQIEFAGMELIIRLDERVRWVNIDPSEMQRVIMNLIHNAVQHNSEGTDIYIELCDTKQEFCLIVADSGEQIPQELISRIYEPFTKVEKSRSDIGHSGLGLAIVKTVIEKHEGKISLEQPYKNYSKAFCLSLKKAE